MSDRFTSEYIKNVKETLLKQLEKAYKKHVELGIEEKEDYMSFICIAAESIFPYSWYSERELQREFKSFGLTLFDGRAFGKKTQKAMLRRFMFLDFIELYLQDIEKETNHANY